LFIIYKFLNLKKRLLYFLLCLSVCHVNAQHQFCIDSTFAQNGFLFTQATLMEADNDHVLLLADSNATLKLRRLRNNGALDTGWGKNGQLDIGPGFTFQVNTIIRDNKNRWALAGVHNKNATDRTGVVYRIYEDGNLDTSFGNNGYVWGDATQANGYSGITVAKNGELLLVGRNEQQSFVVKLFENGAMDTLFGQNKRISFPNKANGDPTYIVSAQQVSTDRIWIIGYLNTEFMPGVLVSQYFISLYSSDGKLLTNSNSPLFPQAINSVAMQVNGGLLAGLAGSWPTNGAVIRLQPNGVKDATFSSDIAPLQFDVDKPYGFPTDITLENNGNILISGFVFDGVPSAAKLVVKRFLPSGKKDISFGDRGSIYLKIHGDTLHYYYNTKHLVQPDGKILIQGSIQNAITNKKKPYLVRITPDKVVADREIPDEPALTYWPNPAMSGHTIYWDHDFDAGNTLCQLHNGQGQLIHTSTVGQSGVLLPDCPTGWYVLSLHTKNGLKYTKINIVRP